MTANNTNQTILASIEDRTAADPDGTQNAHGNVWTSRDRMKGDAVKSSTNFSKDTLDGEIAALEESGEVVTWHGLLAPATDEHLRAIIENEQMSDIPRSTLIGKCNSLLSQNAAEKAPNKED